VFGNLLLAEVLSPLQWLGVSLTLVSIYLINQREKIAEQVRLQSLRFGQPSTSVETRVTQEESKTEQISLLEPSEPLPYQSLPIQAKESETEIWQNR
jgi:hypothetical protein